MSLTPSGRASPDSTADRVTAEVLRRLATGLAVPGQRLIESELATELGVSRGPVREALSRLAAAGHLVLERNRGAVVRRLSLGDVRELYQLREILEGAAAGLAAARVDEGDNRARTEASLVEFRRSVDQRDVRASVANNQAFHELIVEMAGVGLLAEMVRQLRTRAFHIQYRHLATAGLAADSAVQHDAVGKAVLAGDAEAAERLMREHVRLTGERIIAGLRAENGQPNG